MKKEVSNKTIVTLCLGNLSRGLINGIITTYFLSFFIPSSSRSTLPIFIPAAAIAMAVIRGVGMIFDAVTDPLVASLSDKSNHKLGRRIPFMRAAALPYGLFCVLIFFPPVGASSLINAFWVGAMLLLYYLASTVYNIPYMALQAEMVSDQKKRVFLYTIDSLMFVVASALVFTTGLVVDQLRKAGFSELAAYRINFSFWGVLGIITALIPAFAVKEKDYVEQQATYIPILKSLRATFSYRNFTIMTTGYLIMWVAFALFNAALVYYVTNLLLLPLSFSTVILGTSIVVGVATYPLLNKLALRIGKKPLLLGACATYVFLYLAIYFHAPIVALVGAKTVGFLLGFLIAFPIAITNIIPAASFADLAHYDRIKTGENKTGMFVAARNFLNKLSQAIVMFVVPGILLLGSSDGKATAGGVRLTALFAAIFVALALVVYSFYDDKEVVRTISAEDSRPSV